MSRIFSRPMFKRGGSAGQGITSGLDRPGYGVGDRVTSEEILKSYGPAPRAGYNVFDFLTNWGLNMAGNPPSGNIFQTAAKEAQEPYAEFAKGKGEGALRDYAARVQATDKARDINLKLDLAEMAETGYKKYGVQEPRSSFTLAATKNNLNIMGSSPTDILKKSYPSGMALWETANVYDGRFHDNLELAPIGEKEIGGKKQKGIDLEEIGKIENANKKIFLDVISEEWFTVKFENGVWKVNQTAKPNISNDPAEDFTDKALQKLQNTLDATEDATLINNELETDKIDSKKTDSEDAGEIKSKDFTNIVKANEYKKIKSNKISMKITTDLTEVDVNDDAVIFDEAAKVGITIIQSPRTTGRRTHDKTFHVSANEMTKYAFQKLLKKRQREQKYELLASVGITNYGYISKVGLNNLLREYADEIKEKNNTQIVEKKAAGGLMRW